MVTRLQAFPRRTLVGYPVHSLADDDELFIERERKELSSARDALIRRRPVLHWIGLSGYVKRDLGLMTPFAFGDASQDEELRFLRDGQAFWGNHPRLRDLRRGDHSVIVSGAPGSGRTALASMLPLEYVNDPADLFVHVEAGAGREEVVTR